MAKRKKRKKVKLKKLLTLIELLTAPNEILQDLQFTAMTAASKLPAHSFRKLFPKQES